MSFRDYLKADYYTAGIIIETAERKLLNRALVSLFKFAETHPYMVIEAEEKTEEKKEKKKRESKPKPEKSKKKDVIQNLQGTTREFRPYDDLEERTWRQRLPGETPEKGMAGATLEQGWDCWERTKVLLDLADIQTIAEIPNIEALQGLPAKQREDAIEKVRKQAGTITPEVLIQAIKNAGLPVLPNPDWKRQMGIRKLMSLRTAAEAKEPGSAPKTDPEEVYDKLSQMGMEVVDDQEADFQFAQKIINDLSTGRSYIPRDLKTSLAERGRHEKIAGSALGTGNFDYYNPINKPGELQTVTGMAAGTNKVAAQGSERGRELRGVGTVNMRPKSFMEPQAIRKNITPFTPDPVDDDEIARIKAIYPDDPSWTSGRIKDLLNVGDIYKSKVGPHKFKTEDYLRQRGRHFTESVSPEEILQRWREIDTEKENRPLLGKDGKPIIDPRTSQPMKNMWLGKYVPPEEQANFPDAGFAVDKAAAAYMPTMHPELQQLYKDNPDLAAQHFVHEPTQAIRAAIAQMGVPIGGARLRELLGTEDQPGEAIGAIDLLLGDQARRENAVEIFTNDERRRKLIAAFARNYVRQLTMLDKAEKSASGASSEDGTSTLDAASRSGFERGQMSKAEIGRLEKENPAETMLTGQGIDPKMFPGGEWEKLIQAVTDLESPESHQQGIEALGEFLDKYGDQIPRLQDALDDILNTAKKKLDMAEPEAEPTKKDSGISGDELAAQYAQQSKPAAVSSAPAMTMAQKMAARKAALATQKG
jgi:hypothetical protein